MATIAVIGSVNLDIVAQAPKLPTPGETVTGADLHRFPGGKGANQALAAQRLGADVRLVACVGDDAAADEPPWCLEDVDLPADEAAIAAVLFSGAVGVFFGFYPARRASRLDPIEALRFE